MISGSRCMHCQHELAPPDALRRGPLRCPGCGRVVADEAACESDRTAPVDRVELSPPAAVTAIYDLVIPDTELPGAMALDSALPLRCTAAAVTGQARAAEERTLLEIVKDSALGASQLQGLSLCLVALSIADILMTFALLRNDESYYESNPVAGWFFARWNMAGLVAFKFSAIAGAIALGELIERRRGGLGKLVLAVGCAAAAAVVWHSLRLYLGTSGLPIVGDIG